MVNPKNNPTPQQNAGAQTNVAAQPNVAPQPEASAQPNAAPQPNAGPQPEAGPQPNAAPRPQAAGASLGHLRMPSFDEDAVDIWFSQIESIFAVTCTSDDLLRFNVTKAIVPAKHLKQFRSIIVTPPIDGTAYAQFKQKVIDYFAETESTRLRRLLSDVQLGDRRPSRLLDEMRELSNNSMDEKMLKQIWKQRLPQNVQQILAGAQETTSLADLAKMADSIQEVEKQRTVNAITAQPNTSIDPNVAIIAAITELTKKVSALAATNDGSSRRSRSQNRARAATPAPNNGVQNGAAANENTGPSMCWYHRMYANEARKCVQPCSFQQAAPTQQQP